MIVDLSTGDTFAGHRIERRLGRGGMAAVYLATHIALERQVALKVIDAGLSEDEDFRRRFLQESQIAASFHHAHVIPVFQAGEADGVLYLTMRYVPSSDLRELLRREGPLLAGRAVTLICQIASALDYAHSRDLIHRDVKPANILVEQTPSSITGATEHVYLADFGLTIRVRANIDLTDAGRFMGTVDYVAPEQIRGGAVDRRADIYSLGCVLYECLTGVVPFPRATDAAALDAHLHDQSPRASAERPGVANLLDGVIAKALAKTPAERFDTAADFCSAAEAAVRDAGVTGLAPRPGAASGATVVAPRPGAETGATVLAPPPARESSPTELVPQPAQESSPTVLVPQPAQGSGATVLAPQPAPVHEPALPRPAVAPPKPKPRRVPEHRPTVFRPPRARSRWLVPAALAVIGAVAVAGAVLLLHSRGTNVGPAAPLRVTAVSLDVVPSSATGHCPTASFTFVGHITTNGSAGTIDYRWLRPDGQLGAGEAIAVVSGERAITEDLLFTFSGSGQTTGSAQLEVLSPATERSSPIAVHYLCP